MIDGQKVPVAVVGVGRMGQHHARVYSNVSQADLVAVVDRDVEKRETLADEIGCAAYETVDALLAEHREIEAVSVVVPTAHHEAVAAPLVERGIACLVEKPLAPDAAHARRLMDLARQKDVVLQVGHTERFNPVVRKVAAMGITPRFMEVHRVSPMTFRSMDVGVVMDMMIHDLDIVLMFVGSPLRRVDAAGVAVFGEHEDVANARLVFESGCVANLTASRLALKTDRKLRLFSEDAYVSMDYQRRSGLIIRKSDNAAGLAAVKEQLAVGADLSDLDYSQLVNVDELTMDGHADQTDALTAQLTSFVEAVRDGQRPEVDADDGYAAVLAAEQVVRAVREHQWEGLAEPRV